MKGAPNERILEVVIYKAFCLDVVQGHIKGIPNERILEVVIYKAFCLDVAQGHMKGAPNERILEVVIYKAFCLEVAQGHMKGALNERILEVDIIKQVEMKEKIRKEYLRITRKLLETKLHRKNFLKVINTWAVHLVRYLRQFSKWIKNEALQMDQRTSKFDIA